MESKMEYYIENYETILLDLKYKFLNGDPYLIGILIGIIVILVTIVLFAVRRKRNLRQAVLLIGLSDGGKTVLFSKLASNKTASTFTSMKENSSFIQLSNRQSLKLVDIPGNDRLRFKYLDEFKPLARGIIFVIDSLNFSREIRDVAEFLYTILCDRIISQNRPPFLIACNKQDETMAKSCKVIQSQLEKEINTLRVTRSAALEAITDTGNNNTFLGRHGKDFQFADLKPFMIDFSECSALGGEDDSCGVNNVWKWLESIG